MASQDLSLPLIGTLAHDIDVASSAGLEAPSRPQEEQSEERRTSCCEWTMMNLAIPTILLLQFGMAFGLQDAAAETGIRWTLVIVSILLYVSASYLYRITMTDLQISNLLVVLLPELLMNVTVVLVFFHQVFPAFVLLAASSLFLSLVVVAGTLFLLHQKSDDDEDDDKIASVV
jgi:hypothetical protein